MKDTINKTKKEKERGGEELIKIWNKQQQKIHTHPTHTDRKKGEKKIRKTNSEITRFWLAGLVIKMTGWLSDWFIDQQTESKKQKRHMHISRTKTADSRITIMRNNTKQYSHCNRPL